MRCLTSYPAYGPAIPIMLGVLVQLARRILDRLVGRLVVWLCRNGVCAADTTHPAADSHI